MSQILKTEERTETGTKRTRRLRRAGFTPAVLYGDGSGETLSLTIPTRDVDAAMRAGSQVVRLEGKVTDDALIREIQWDAFGAHILHMDLTRINLKESITVTLSVETVGDAPGLKEGGYVKLMRQDLEIECPANVLPDKIVVNINSLELLQSITAGELELPEGARFLCDPSDVIVQCIVPTEIEEDEAEVGEGSAEPEVIGRQPDDEEEAKG